MSSLHNSASRSSYVTSSPVLPFFILCFFITLQSRQDAQAEGFRIYGLSSEAQERAEAVVASGSDASAIWYNPAGLTRSSLLDVSFNTNNMFLYSKYRDLAGREEKSQENHFFLPSLYLASNVGTENIAVGIGINTPFGLSTRYSRTSAFRYITTGGEISLININPTIAYKALPNLSFGVGLDYYYSKAELRQQYPWAAIVPGSPDGSATIQGKGDGVGFNFGLLYQPVEQHKIGLTYRSQVVVKYTGKKGELTNIPPAVQGKFPAGTGDVYATGARTAIRFPDIISFGYSYAPSDKWVGEIGGQWTNWNDARSIDITLDQPTVLFANSSTKLDWKNSWVLRSGVTHHCTEKISISAGYFFDSTPTNEATYSPLIPDGDNHVFSVGLKYRHNDFVVSLPFVGILQTGTSSINSQVTDATGTQNTDGNYSLYGFQIGLAITYRFPA